MSTYALDVVCMNCHKRFRINQIKGMERPRSAECPNCGCSKITYVFEQQGRCNGSNWMAQVADVFFNGRSAK